MSPGTAGVISRRLACFLVLIVPLSVAAALPPAADVRPRHDIRPGPGVTATRLLSSYAPSLAGTPGDTEVYVLDGAQPGPTVFVAGGTHGNEIAGIVAATVLVEHVRVERGRLIVVPHANNSAITDRDPERPGPAFITIRTGSGDRRFRYGSRRTRPSHEARADPPAYRHPRAAEASAGNEIRNLNRVYPGLADGTLTQRIAYGIVQLLRTERVSIAYDFHETAPESRLTWMMVAHPGSLDLAAAAVLDLEEAGIFPKLEPSSEASAGMSHREWGDAVPVKAFLFETPSPSMVNAAGAVDAVDDPALPLSRRVGAHLLAFRAVLGACSAGLAADRPFVIHDLPTLADVVKHGVGAYLR